MAERREAVDLRGDIEAALPLLRQRIAERREAACHAEAASRMVGISRAAGSLVDNARKDNARVARYARALRAAVERRAERSAGLGDLHVEADVLARRFGLERPLLPVLALPPQDPTLAEALLPAREEMPNGRVRPISTDGPLDITPRDEGSVLVKGSSGSRVVSGDTGRLLAAGGPWSRTPQEAERERVAGIEREEEQKQNKRDRVDGWLRDDQLRDGPVPIDAIKVEARRQGIALSGPGTHGATLMAAFGRLGVVELHRIVTSEGGERVRDRSTILWGLPEYDRDAFAEIDHQRSRMPAGAMRW